ncbi:MAG: hypothetical protein OEV18_05175, partial [Deltaproteobacteria bacterium]|nr:hypothetical protein [Deltaproteobacteria bacterium]
HFPNPTGGATGSIFFMHLNAPYVHSRAVKPLGWRAFKKLLYWLTRMFHESPAATADMTVLPGVLGCRTLRRTV